MKYVKDTFTQTLEIKQSKFIAYLTPYNQYNKTLSELKASHPKARHFVAAYRYFNDFFQIVEHSSDDGEPKGTSGKPSLMVMQGHELIDIAVIIVRYFGGTKLGTGRLVRAYSDAVNLVIENSKLFTYEKQVYQRIELNYSDVRAIEYECKACDVSINEKSYEKDVRYLLQASEENMKLFLENIKNRNISLKEK